MSPPEPLPRWFFALPLLAALAWWPASPFWASDDFVALHYAQDGARALRDFAGPQYGAADVWFFYRPLITLSFWFDALVAGGEPFFAHLGNVLAHAISALLVALLWRRLLPDGLAFCAGLCWALAPGHAGAIAWAVGRVDSYTAVPFLLSLHWFLRWREGARMARLLALLAFAVALLAKELALALPGLLGLLALATGRGGGARRRLHALLSIWPFALVLLLYLAWRLAVLGRFGGYLGADFAPASMARGLGRILLDLLIPLRWIEPAAVAPLGAAARWLPWLGAVPVLLGLGAVLQRRRPHVLLLLVLLFLTASVPVAGFFAGADNLHNLRYFYVPFAALAGILCSSATAAAATLLCFLPALASIRFEQWQADRMSARLHAQLRAQERDGAAGPWFVAGLPHSNPRGTALQFHFGIDRLLEPPFGPGGVAIRAHRPILPVPSALRLEDQAGVPVAPPGGTTLWCRGAGLVVQVPEAPMPALPLVVDGSERLDPPHLQQLKDGQARLRLRTPGLRPQAYRVTFFTATGYLCTIVQDHADPGAADGEVDVYRLFSTAKWARDGEFYLVRGLEIPTVLDLDPSFPVLVEAGRLDGTAFAVTHRARTMPVLVFDRGFPAWVRRALGLER